MTVTVIVNLQGCVTGTHCASQGSEARSLTPTNESLIPSNLPQLSNQLTWKHKFHEILESNVVLICLMLQSKAIYVI